MSIISKKINQTGKPILVDIDENVENAVIILPLNLHNSIQETAYLFSTIANQKRLLESLEQVKKGKIVRHQL